MDNNQVIQTFTPPPSPRDKRMPFLVIGIIIFILLACICFGCFMLIFASTKSYNSAVENLNTLTPTQSSYYDSDDSDTKVKSVVEGYINQRLELNGYILTVKSVADYESSTDKPAENYKFIAIEVEVENKTNKSTSVSNYDFDLIDNDEYVYSPSNKGKTPAISYQTLDNGRKVKGFITFEIPVDSRAAILTYTPDYQYTHQISVSLKEKSK